jgi:hypothetical protein
MEKSIESIWKNGFGENQDLLLPKVSKLYTRKSLHITEKFTRMFSINLKAIVFGGLLIVLGTWIIGLPWAGIGTYALLLMLVYIGNKEMKKMKAIDKGESAYELISSFYSWWKDSIDVFTRLYRIFYPAFFLVWVLGFWVSENGQEAWLTVQAKFEFETFYGIPIGLGIAVLVMTGIITLLSGPLYRLDLRIVYGPIVAKLEELLSDMEELRGDLHTNV